MWLRSKPLRHRVWRALIVWTLAGAVALAALASWSPQSIRAAPADTFSLPPYTNEGVVVNDNISTYANFDGHGHDLSAPALAAAGVSSGALFTTSGATFRIPVFGEGVNDNWLAPTTTPLTIPMVAPAGSTVAFLGAATSGPSSGVATLTFSDASTQTFTLALSDWTLNGGASAPASGNSIAATTAYQDLTNTYTRPVVSHVFLAAPVVVPAGKTLASVTLPATINRGKLHIFSVAAIVPTPAYNSEGISPADGAPSPADFDGAGDSYSSAALGAAGFAPGAHVSVGGVAFTMPTASAGASDNWSQAGQVIPLPADSMGFLGFLGASSGGQASGQATISYTDGSTQTLTLTFSDWTLNGGADRPAGGTSIAATMPYAETAAGAKLTETTYLFVTYARLLANKTPLIVALPGSTGGSSLHVFAVGVAPPLTGGGDPTTGPPQPQSLAPGAWTGYLYDAARDGYNSAETLLTQQTYPSLKKVWSVSASGPVSDQPVVANGVTYWGSWDGLLHASSATGASLWTADLGVTTDNSCDPTSAGVASSPAVGAINGQPTIFVAGGDSRLYAVNAASGGVIWSTSLGTTPSHFLWASPLIYNGAIYEGVSSFGDCPLIPGAVVKLNETTGEVQSVLHTTPAGCSGVGVWGSVTVDAVTGTLYFATGNGNTCGSAEPLAESVVAARASDLSVIASWQIPNQATGGDIDFGTTPTLFTATISGQQRALLGLVNKDGVYYAFDRTNIAAGPLWSDQIGAGGDCPQCGAGNIAPSAFDGSTLYVASGNTTINGVACQGSVQALDPATGAARWQNCLSGHVLAALTITPGVVVATAGNSVFAFNTSTGATLWSFVDTSSSSLFYGPAAVSSGRLYVGNMDGIMYAFSIGGNTAKRRSGSGATRK
jgi:outer membrane protein assembly factor BamB